MRKVCNVLLIEYAVNTGDRSRIQQIAAGHLIKHAVKQVADHFHDCGEHVGVSQNAARRDVEHADRRYDVEIEQSANKVVSQRGLKPGFAFSRCNIKDLLNRKQAADDCVKLHPRILCGCKVDGEGTCINKVLHLPSPLIIIAKRPVNDPVNRFFPLLRVSFELAEFISFGCSKFIADIRILTEVSKVSQIRHTNVHADGQANIQPVAVVFVQQDLVVVVGINQCIIVVGRKKLGCKLADNRCKQAADVLAFQVFSRRKVELRHKQLNQFRRDTADDFLVGGAFIHHKLIVAVVVIFTENGFGAVVNNIASRFLRIFKQLIVAAFCPVDTGNHFRCEDGRNDFAEEVVNAAENGGVASRGVGDAAVRLRGRNELVQEVTGDFEIPFDNIKVRIGVGKVRRENLILEAIIVVTVDYFVIRPLPKIFALFLGEEHIFGVRKRVHFFAADIADISEFRTEPFGKCFLNGAVENDRRHFLEHIRNKLIKQGGCGVGVQIQRRCAGVQSTCKRGQPVAVVFIILEVVAGHCLVDIFAAAFRLFGLIEFRFFSRILISYGVEHIAGEIITARILFISIAKIIVLCGKRVVADAGAGSIFFIRSGALGLGEQRLNEAVQNRLHTAVALRARQSTHLRQVIVFSFQKREDETFNQAGDVFDDAQVYAGKCGARDAEVDFARAKDIADDACVILKDHQQTGNDVQLIHAFTRHTFRPSFQVYVRKNAKERFD